MGFRINGQDKLMYNHLDSYPSGLGDNLVEQLRELIKNPDDLKTKAAALHMVKHNDPEPTQEQIAALHQYADLGVSNQKLTDWYCLLRRTQGELAAILDAGYGIDANDFIKDSLFCKYAYILNLDEWLFEFYRGFQQLLHNQGRYASETANKSGYFPCALVKTFPLDDIPKDWKEIVEPEEEEATT